MRDQNACDRSYINAFDRIRAECVCDVGLCARTNASEFECRPVSAIEHIVVRSIAQCNNFFFFFLTKIFTHT